MVGVGNSAGAGLGWSGQGLVSLLGFQCMPQSRSKVVDHQIACSAAPAAHGLWQPLVAFGGPWQPFLWSPWLMADL